MLTLNGHRTIGWVIYLGLLVIWYGSISSECSAHHRNHGKLWRNFIDSAREEILTAQNKEIPTPNYEYYPNSLPNGDYLNKQLDRTNFYKSHRKSVKPYDVNQPQFREYSKKSKNKGLQNHDEYEYYNNDIRRPISKTVEFPPSHHSEGTDGSSVGRRKVEVVLDNKVDRSQHLLDEDLAMGTPPGPHFDRSLPRNISVQNGKTAVLSCRVLNRDNRKVSWIRHDDLHILTVDQYKYSTDQRVSVIHNIPNKEWVLRIKGANHSDEGKYECQLSTKPVLSYIVNLKVVVPHAEILNAPDIYVHRGSLINLTCIVNHGTDHPVYIYWYQNRKMVNVDESRTTVQMSTHEHGKTVSKLLIHQAQPEDSGKYMCKPSNGEAAIATLHILNGELQAAMQTNVGQRLIVPSSLWVITLLVLNTLLHSDFIEH